MQTPTEQAFDAAPVVPEPTVEAPAPVVTQEDPTPTPGAAPEAEPVVDYKEKFGASSREALRLKTEAEQEKARADAAEAELARLRGEGPGSSSEALFPGFEDLDEDAQRNLAEFTGTIERRAVERVYQDPAIAFARETFNAKKFGDAFEKVATQFPQLRESESEFKAKYFNPTNVPDNIETILVDVAKSYLFDKAHDLGTQEGREQAERIDVERGSGGPGPIVTTSRTLEEWHRMQQENPAEFAKHAKEYEADAAAGKLGE